VADKNNDSAEMWKYVCGVCADGAPVMMESRSGFPKHEALLFHMSARCLSKGKRSKPRFWGQGRNKVIFRTESKRVLVLL